MVKVKVERSHKEIVTIKIFDHAGYADAGQDLVCAGVSSISVGMMNALDLLVPETCIFQLKEAYVEIKTKQSNEKTLLLLEGMLVQLKTLQESYSSYITINYQEV